MKITFTLLFKKICEVFFAAVRTIFLCKAPDSDKADLIFSVVELTMWAIVGVQVCTHSLFSKHLFLFSPITDIKVVLEALWRLPPPPPLLLLLLLLLPLLLLPPVAVWLKNQRETPKSKVATFERFHFQPPRDSDREIVVIFCWMFWVHSACNDDTS